MLWKRTILLTFALVLLCSAAIALTTEAMEVCLKHGESSRIFPDGTTADDLIVETYTIDAAGESYTVWLVSTNHQRQDVEFGWLRFHSPSNTVVQSSRTRRSYEEAKLMLTWEENYGCSYFWPAALKAHYYHELRGDEARITDPGANEITEDLAIKIARQALIDDVGLKDDQIDQLLLSAEFYQDNTPNDSVQAERYWGITFREKDENLCFPPLYAVVIDGVSGIPEYAVDYQKDLIIEHTK